MHENDFYLYSFSRREFPPTKIHKILSVTKEAQKLPPACNWNALPQSSYLCGLVLPRMEKEPLNLLTDPKTDKITVGLLLTS